MLVRSLRIEDKVEFKGALSPQEVRVEMQKATVFVQHSVTTVLMGDKEGTPVGIMEAMAMAKPIVATRHAGIAELITDGESGILVPEYDVEKMSEEMVRLALDSELRKELGKNARKKIEQNRLIFRSLEEFSELIDKHKLKG